MAHVASQTWRSVLSAIAEAIPASSFETWFSTIRPVAVEPESLKLGVANLHFKNFLEKRYADVVADALVPVCTN